MADNVAITAGSGTTVAADEVVDGTLGTVKVQYVKLMDGTLDGTTKATVGANGLKVDGSGAVQPVSDNSGSLTVDAPVATPVFVRLSDGAAAIATLPVSLATAPSTPVTGTFWQATQPVSDAAGSLTVDAPVGTPVFTRLSDGAAALIGQKVAASSLPVVLASDTAGPTLTKGTQGASGFSTQDLKDAGRNQTNYFMAAPIITTNAEAMQSMTGYKSGAAVGATVTPAVVTSGKTYRITKIILSYYNVATVGSARVNLRVNTGGTAVVSSPLYMTWQVGLSGDGTSTAGHVSTYDFSFPDGLEFAAGTGIAFGVIGEGAVPTTATAVGYVLIQVFGFEY